MAHALSANPHFIGSAAHASLASQPLGFIDIGARGGAHKLIEPIADMAAVMGFEADPSEFERLQREAKTWPFAVSHILPTALSDKTGEATLYLTRNPNNISLLEPDADFAARYGNSGLDVIGEVRVKTTTLDQAAWAPENAGQRWGELLKVDAQGADYFILQGARRTLAERTVAVVCEALVLQMYEGQKLFSDIEADLRGLGFAFYGFVETNMRSKRLLDKRTMVGRERLFWADAVFLKDPVSATGKGPRLTERQSHALYVSALLFGYYDFALELALAYPPEEFERARRLVADLAAYAPDRTAEDVRMMLARIEADPANANVHAGRYVDERRTNFDYRDIPSSD